MEGNAREAACGGADAGQQEDEPMTSPRWDREEHARFMQALETFGGEQTGDEWRKITAFVQTRSLEEVRVHGQQYLQHLVEIHQLQRQHHHHAQQQLQQQQRLLQLSHAGHDGGAGTLPSSLTASRGVLGGGNQNDPNGPNHVRPKTAPPKTKAAPSPLSVAASSVANAMHAQTLAGGRQGGDTQPVGARKTVVNSSTSSSSGGGGGGGGAVRKLKVWTFQEDKVLETALASWQSGKPYSWPKIAATLPGKTSKDVRARYEQLVEDVASIDNAGGLRHPPPAASFSAAAPRPATTSSSKGRPPPHSGLSSRIAPPPPIQVPPPPPSVRGKATASQSATTSSTGSSSSAGLLGSPGVFPGSTRGGGGRFVLTPSFGGSSGMLSPTFLDFLAGEDKPPLAYAGLTDLPSLLLPSPTVGSGVFSSRGPASTPSSFSMGDAASLLGPLTSPLGLELNTPGGARGRRQLVTPRGLVTPRIWHEFLADDLKFDSKSPSSRASAGGTRDGGGGGATPSAAPDASDAAMRRSEHPTTE